MYAGLPWIEWINVLDRSRMREVSASDHSDLYSFGFPLAMESQGMRLHVETPTGFLDPAIDLLPSANGRGFGAQRVAALEEESGYSVLLTNRQSYLVFLENAARSGVYTPPENATLLLGAMGVAHEGRSKDKGIVPLRDGEPRAPSEHSFTYRLATQPQGFDPVQAARLGWESHLALSAQYVAGREDTRHMPAAGSFLTVDQPNVMIAELKGATFGEKEEVIIRLQELGGRPTSVSVHSAFPVQKAWLASVTEAKLREVEQCSPLQVQLEGNAVVTLRLQVGSLTKVLRDTVKDREYK